MHPEVEAILGAMPREKREAVAVALAAAADSSMPANYTREAQELDAVSTVWRMRDADPLRLVKSACGALLDGRARAERAGTSR